jgi:O-antigen ligase
MTGMAPRFDRAQWQKTADWLAAALAASLPWSTTATLIIAALWLIALLPTIGKEDLRQVLTSPAAWLVLALIGFAALGMLWADIPFRERMRGIDSYVKLIAIPLLFIHFRRPDRAECLLYAFMVSCTILLALALIALVSPAGTLWGYGKTYGVPVKDSIAQSAEFALCGAFSLVLALREWRRVRRMRAVVFLVLGFFFFADIAFLVASRTALLSIPLLLLVIVAKEFPWKRSVAIGAAGLAAIVVLAASSSTIRGKVAGLWTEVEVYQADNSRTSAGERLEFWKKSIDFISRAPLLGHGTGSIRNQFERAAAAGQTSALVSANPHNQTFAVGIQLGFAGMTLLYAMWIAHLLLFRGSGLAATLGMIVVVQNIFGSLFNSHLFDFTHGWIYVIGVGVAGGVAMGRRGVAAAPAHAAPART